MSALDHDISWILTDMHLNNTREHTLMIAALVIATYAFINIIRYLSDKGNRRFWNSHPWAGPQTRLFPKTRAGIDSIRHSCEIVGKGYHQVCCYLNCEGLLACTVIALTGNRSSPKTTFRSSCLSSATTLWWSYHHLKCENSFASLIMKLTFMSSIGSS